MSLPDSQKIFKIFHSSVRGEGLATGPLRYTSSKNRRPRGLQYCLQIELDTSRKFPIGIACSGFCWKFLEMNPSCGTEEYSDLKG